ncbi:hypothetical protein EUX98_g2605 [Antrodiella citrinella]|uniref:Uncharacterized protein n=1 Tax=Antrodiella citrinella TaxID=2447956 RepID=A0A4S4MYK7_9APHY|nr:hypothetical protein EUX98_g2605 [Antrodiella citrinella]
MATTATTTTATTPRTPPSPLHTMHVVNLHTDTDPALISPALSRVRFDSECVLIPEPVAPSRMPRLLMKSYSLPLWRKKAPSLSPSSSSFADASEQPSPDDGRPRFGFRSSSKQSRARSSSRDPNDPTRRPLVPCIVDHNHPHRRTRRPSLPIAPKLDVVTVPLRECCLACHPVIEETLVEGSAWQEKFSRGARRRRNSSADDLRPSHHKRVSEDLPGFESILNVDEVDKRRRSRGTSPDTRTPTSITLNDSLENTNDTADDIGLLPSLTRQKLTVTTLPRVLDTAREEDEEDQLFPLPSPRRTPNGSPIPSPVPTPSSSTTNLTKTIRGQKSLQNMNGSSGSLPLPRMQGSPRLTVPPSPRLQEGNANTQLSSTSLSTRGRETGGCFESAASDSSTDSVPELTRSASLLNVSSSTTDSPFSSPSIPYSRPMLIPAQRKFEEDPFIPVSPPPSPQVARHRERGNSVSMSPPNWRKIPHTAGMGVGGFLKKAGADVLKGVTGVSGVVAV